VVGVIDYEGSNSKKIYSKNVKNLENVAEVFEDSSPKPVTKKPKGGVYGVR
jgi:hypothetical protein